MYQNHTPKTQLRVDSPDFDAPHESADGGKLQMYKAQSGMPYSAGKASQARADVGAGMPPGTSESSVYSGHEDPHYGSYHQRRKANA